MKCKQYLAGLLVLLLPFGQSTYAQNSPQVVKLDEAIAFSLKNNISLKVSDTKVKLAEAKMQQVKDKNLPQAGVSAQYSRLYVLSPFQMYMGESAEPAFGLHKTHFDANPVMASASKEIFTGFAEKAQHQSAEYLIEASKLDAEKDREDLTFNVIAAYYNIFKIIKSSEILDENLKLLEAKEHDVQNLLREGVLTSNELLKVQLQKSNLQLAQVDVKNAREVAHHNFNLLLGLPESSPVTIDTSLILTPLPIADVTELTQNALTYRLDLKATDYRFKTAQLGLKQTKSAFYPHLDVSAMYIYLNPAPNHAFIPPTNQFLNALNLGVSLKYNISSLYAWKGRLQEAKLNIEQVGNQQALQRDQINTEVFSQYKNYQSAQEKIAVANTALAQATRSFKLTDSKFRNGMLLSSDLLEAQTLLLQSQLNLLQAKVDTQLAYYRLQKAVGRLNE